ncbi:hypothetical protein [Marinimicrobium locisalis]|uniref:hypothetical protein n=1 Tax=Marinimicrobium locisalis TaxID=546022 RepID=UPI003221A826
MRFTFKVGLLILPLIPMASQADEAPEQAMEAPWESILDTPYDNDSSDTGKMLKKRWRECAGMVAQANMAAETVASVIQNPEEYYVTDEQNRDQIRQIFPTNSGTFRDQINEKIQEIAFEHWEQATFDGSKSPQLSKMAWGWCVGHSPETFSEL